MSLKELRQLPKSERAQLLQQAAAKAFEDYAQDTRLTDFEAMSEDDLHV
jgi:hypothetical protein